VLTNKTDVKDYSIRPLELSYQGLSELKDR